jgi:AraC-like DNA-binding protein
VIMACHRLIHTHDSIEQIAEAHGFANRFHFTRVFRAVRGTSPAAWRRECLRGMRAQSPPLGTTRISDDENPAAV